MRESVKGVQLPQKTPAANLWVFTTSTLWLLATSQFNVVRANPQNDFCLILTEEENTQYGEYYKKLFCEAFKKFNGHKKIPKALLGLLQINIRIPETHQDAKFQICIGDDIEDFLSQKKETHHICFMSDNQDHVVLANLKIKEGYSCQVKSPKSKRGEFNAEHVGEMFDAIRRRYDHGELTELIIVLDLDDTIIKLERMQYWCLGMNFFNPEALRQIRQIYLQYKEQLKIQFVAMTARNKEGEKSAPLYFHAKHLLPEFLRLAGIFVDEPLERGKEFVFYTPSAHLNEKPPVISPKYNKILEQWGCSGQKRFAVLFDNDASNWSKENQHLHLHFVEVKNLEPEDFDLGIPQVPFSTAKRRPPAFLYPQKFVDDPRSESVGIRYSVNQFPAEMPPEEKSSDSQPCCCVSFFKIVRKLFDNASGQSLTRTKYRSYNTQGQ